MDKPTVSVIIPTYNRASFLNRTIKSVLNQTFNDFELIIVDDGSTDNTKELIYQLMEEDSRIRYIWQKNSGGPAEPINTGIKNAIGEYIAILGSDDEFLPEKLEKQVNKFQFVSEKVGLIYCGLIYLPENREKQRKIIIPKLKGKLFTKILQDCFVGGITPLVKKECFQRFGYFDSDLPSGEDWDMWIRLSKHYEFDFVDEALAIYHIHGKQIMSDFSDSIEGFEKLLEKHREDIQKYPMLYSEHLFRLGIFHCLNGNMECSAKYFSKSVKIKPQMKVYLNIILLKIAPPVYKKILFFMMKKFTITGLFV